MQRAMNGTEIATELGISKQAVSMYTKKALKKLYTWLPEKGLTESPKETFLALLSFFQIDNDDDIREFLSLFPKNIQEEIKENVQSM